MYRYLLFHCYRFYPGGGMIDCELKTNNMDELVPFINEHYNDTLMDYIHYYDTAEDKRYDAVMETYENETGFYRQRFVRWEERRSC
jgi:hypothetical protein